VIAEKERIDARVLRHIFPRLEALEKQPSRVMTIAMRKRGCRGKGERGMQRERERERRQSRQWQLLYHDIARGLSAGA